MTPKQTFGGKLRTFTFALLVDIFKRYKQRTRYVYYDVDCEIGSKEHHQEVEGCIE